MTTPLELSDEIERIDNRHWEVFKPMNTSLTSCGGCLAPWPCDAIRAAAEIRVLQASYDEMHTHNALERRALVEEIGELREALVDTCLALGSTEHGCDISHEPGARGREIVEERER